MPKSIFQKKVFRTGICPNRLENVGREIANKCGGLPLAIVITSGLMKHKWLETWWSQIAESQRSFMVRDPSQYIDSLALSYNLLPRELQQCFLLLGVFPKDYDIPVTKLTWLWIAQGFIHETGGRILENVTEEFLMNLVQRSLLTPANTRADGQIKACRIHDLLRDLCLRKAEEEHFSSHLYTYARAPASDFCYPFELGKVLQEGGSMVTETYKALRILDMESVPVSVFPSDVIQLVNLRYLAIQAHDGSPQATISDLVNLQTLIILSKNNIVVPKTIWDMVNLRHLCIKSGENLIEKPTSVKVTENDGSPNGLASLQTLSLVCPQSCQNMFSKTPNIKKLGFCGPLISSQGNIEFPNIVSLKHLQKLKLANTIAYPEPIRSCDSRMFPKTLKKLTFSNTGLDWEQIWTFVDLPNLEALKLRARAFIGERWETSDKKQFERLKVLKLHDLDLKEWDSGSNNFPGLRRLVVHHCLKLNRIPSDLGKILTLEVIEVIGCSSSALKSARDIEEEQQSYGDDFLKVHTDQKHHVG